MTSVLNTVSGIPSAHFSCYSLWHSDIIICEDDPYYFQQEGEYLPKDKRRAMYTTAEDPAHYVDSLVPSYLRSVDGVVSTWFMTTYSL